MKTKNLVLCAVCAAITCVLAPLSIPIAGMIPITLATFAVMLSGVLLGGRLGALSQVIYLIIGAVGVPVCAGYTPALPKLLGPTGGYLVGYLVRQRQTLVPVFLHEGGGGEQGGTALYHHANHVRLGVVEWVLVVRSVVVLRKLPVHTAVAPPFL